MAEPAFTIDELNLTDQQHDNLADLVYETAEQVAADAINSAACVPFLLAHGYSAEEIWSWINR